MNLKNYSIFKSFKKWYVQLFFSIIIGIVTYFLQITPLFKQFETYSLDMRFKQYPLSSLADTSIVLISIDNSSLEYAQRNQVFWPWPREFYAYATNYLKNDQAKAVLFDIQFYEPDYDRANLDSETSDLAFSDAIAYNQKVILGVQYGENNNPIPEDIKRFSLNISGNKEGYPVKCQGAQFPIEVLRQNALSLGAINISPDNDGVIRRVPLFYNINDIFMPQMSLSAYLDNQTDKSISIAKHFIINNNKKIPLDNDYNYLINWYGNGGTQGVFKYIPFKTLIQTASASEFGGVPDLPKGYFKDKYVIIGATADGLMDLKTSPYTKLMPGMEIWATILSNLLNAHFITQIPGYILILLNILLSFSVFLIFTNLKPIYSSFIIISEMIFMILIICLMWKYRIYLNLIIPIVTIIVSYLAIVLISYLMEGRSKREMRKIFTRYLHPDIIETLIKHPDQIEMGGEEIEATVMFSDIYNFTTYSEGKHPKELVKDLNEYFNYITNTILENNGLLDKYTGDGLMAVFGAPIPRNDHAYLACKTALLHKKYARNLADNKSNPSNLFHINTRLGINTGSIVAGNIGSEKRMDYTAIGDPVNLAARLEGVNKIFKTQIIISHTTWECVKNDFVCRELDYLKVKGKNEPTRIYELLDFYDQKDNYPWINDYQEALELYRKGDFVQAKLLFTNLYISNLKDLPSGTMAERCDYLIKNTPENWDGILVLNIK